MSKESHEELQRWYASVQGTPELALALKHRNTLPEEMIAEWKEAAPGDSENEKELALVFALYQIADKVNLGALLMGEADRSATPLRDAVTGRVAQLEHELAETKARLAARDKHVEELYASIEGGDLAVPVKTSHVDVTPLEAPPPTSPEGAKTSGR